MMLAKVKEQDGIMLANVKVPSIPHQRLEGGRSPME